jgi:hypothetical protein
MPSSPRCASLLVHEAARGLPPSVVVHALRYLQYRRVTIADDPIYKPVLSDYPARKPTRQIVLEAFRKARSLKRAMLPNAPD